jgi:hypothetical protein
MLDPNQSDKMFEHLKTAILELGRPLVDQGVVLTEASFVSANVAIAPFVLVVTPEFRGLLRAVDSAAVESSLPELTLEPKQISAFLKTLRSRSAQQPTLAAQVKQATAIHNQPSTISSIYPTLVQQLFDTFSEAFRQRQDSSTAMTCQPIVDAALHQQIQQEQLINQVATQIRQSLELSTILQTAVSKVLECLEVDRLLIYRFEWPSVKKSTNGSVPKGVIAYESCSRSSIPALMASPKSQQWATTPTQYQRTDKATRLPQPEQTAQRISKMGQSSCSIKAKCDRKSLSPCECRISFGDCSLPISAALAIGSRAISSF